jgi:hypothetical protein
MTGKGKVILLKKQKVKKLTTAGNITLENA